MRHPVCHLETEREYFYRLDVELIDHMRRRAALQERRQRIAEACQIQDPRILDALEELGYDQATIALLYFVPLVHVAWIDGSVSQAERNRILVMAGLRGVKENPPAYQQLLAWLDKRPSEEFFAGTLTVIENMLNSLPPDEHEARGTSLIQGCREVAFASCGLFGWKSKVCIAKRLLLHDLSRRFHPAGRAAAAGVGV